VFGASFKLGFNNGVHSLFSASRGWKGVASSWTRGPSPTVESGGTDRKDRGARIQKNEFIDSKKRYLLERSNYNWLWLPMNNISAR
jgi:hypothetical protein